MCLFWWFLIFQSFQLWTICIGSTRQLWSTVCSQALKGPGTQSQDVRGESRGRHSVVRRPQLKFSVSPQPTTCLFNSGKPGVLRAVSPFPRTTNVMGSHSGCLCGVCSPLLPDSSEKTGLGHQRFSVKSDTCCNMMVEFWPDMTSLRFKYIFFPLW